jgi:uncharacterized membrane protein
MDRTAAIRCDGDMTELLDTLRSPVLLAATVAAGLQAGTYYTWACGVMPGLAKVDDRTFTSSMTHVNVAIVNPVFMLTFLGTPLLAAAAVATSASSARGWAIAGLVCAVGTVAVTIAGNVPLNDALAAGGSRAGFETAWVRWNVVRAITSTGALATLAWAALRS